MNHRYQAEQLEASIAKVCYIRCDNCNAERIIHAATSRPVAALILIDEGWQQRGLVAVCPGCVGKAKADDAAERGGVGW